MGEGSDDVRDVLNERVEQIDADSLETIKDDVIRVLDHQVNNINDIDDKASETFRYCVLFLSVLILATSLVLDTELMYWTTTLHPAALIGAAIAGTGFIYGVYCIFVAAQSSIEAYTSTRIRVGPSKLLSDVDRRRYTKKEWHYLVIYNARERWIPENTRNNEDDAKSLSRGHTYLQRGLWFVFAAVLLYLATLVLDRTVGIQHVI